MPKKIKKPEVGPCERGYRITAAAGLVASLLLAGWLIALIRLVDRTESKVFYISFFAVFAVYLIGSLMTFIMGIRAYRREDKTGPLIQGISGLIGCAAGIYNLRTALLLLFTALGLDKQADGLTGNRTYQEFIETQYSNWTLLLAAIALTGAAGVAACVKIAKAKRN